MSTTLEGRRGGGDADIAAVGALVADPSRCRMLFALDDGRALPAGRLADEAGVSPATASSHLSKLVDAGFLVSEVHGRHRYYRLAGEEIGNLLETLAALAPPAPVRSLRESTRAGALRRARTCYDHLAGRLGVDLMASLLDAGHLVGDLDPVSPGSRSDGPVGAGRDVDYALTASGGEFLCDLGVVLPPRRRAVRYCVDWTEQRHHLGGGVGRGLLDLLHGHGWIERSTRDRSVAITAVGARELPQVFGPRLDEAVARAS